MTQLRVLFVSGQAAHCQVLAQELKRGGFELLDHRVDSLEKLKSQVLSGGLDLILFDWDFPGPSPSLLFELLGKAELKTPVLFFSEAPQDEDIVAALRMGGRDFLRLSRLERLGSLVERELIESENRRSSSETERELREFHEKMKQAQKLEAIGRLAGGIAHDFNNLLGLILGRCEIISQGLKDRPGLAEEVSEIERAAESAGKLISQLMSFSRDSPLRTECVDANSILRSTQDFLKRTLGEKIELHEDLEEPLPELLVDPVQLEQVIINLAINARDAMPEGGRLSLMTRSIEDVERLKLPLEHPNLPHVLIRVSDEGHGIPSSIREKVFEPFFTTKGEEQGTGLGLAAVYGFVKQSRGEIQLESSPGNGCVFSLYIPVLASSIKHTALDAAPGTGESGSERDEAAPGTGDSGGERNEAAPGTGDSGGERDEAAPTAAVTNQDFRGSETILLVEDDDAYRSLIEHMLKRYGYDVITAESSESALALAATTLRPIDLLISDVILSGMNGFDLAEELMQEKRELKVIFISGYGLPLGFKEKFSSPCTHGVTFLQKPFRTITLAKRLRTALDEDILDSGRSRANGSERAGRILIVDDEEDLLLA